MRSTRQARSVVRYRLFSRGAGLKNIFAQVIALDTRGKQGTWVIEDFILGNISELNVCSCQTAESLHNYVPPDSLLSKSQGSTHILPNGNALVNWGSSGAVTEYNREDEPVCLLCRRTLGVGLIPRPPFLFSQIFHAYFDSGDLGVGIENYRAFKAEWHGNPTEEAALVGLVDGDKTTLYVSWSELFSLALGCFSSS
jgi:hypothetical protein